VNDPLAHKKAAAQELQKAHDRLAHKKPAQYDCAHRPENL